MNLVTYYTRICVVSQIILVVSMTLGATAQDSTYYLSSNFLCSAKLSSSALVAGTNGVILQSDDSCRHWHRLFLDNVNSFARISCASSINDSCVSFLYSYFATQFVYATTDAGSTWTSFSFRQDSASSIFRDMTLSPTGFGLVVGDSGDYFITKDFGKSWLPGPNRHFTTQSLRNVVIDEQKRIFLRTDSAVYVSVDLGSKWSRIATDENIRETTLRFMTLRSGNPIFLNKHDDTVTIVKYSPSVNRLQAVDTIIDTKGYNISKCVSVSDSLIVVVGSIGLYIYDPQSKKSVAVSLPNNGINSLTYASAVNSAICLDDKIILVGPNNYIARANVRDRDITLISLLPSISYSSLIFNQGGTSYASGSPNNIICKSYDYGVTWLPNEYSNEYNLGLKVDLFTVQSGRTLFAFNLSGRSGLYESNNEGVSWYDNSAHSTLSFASYLRKNVEPIFTGASDSGFVISLRDPESMTTFVAATNNNGSTWKTWTMSGIMGIHYAYTNDIKSYYHSDRRYYYCLCYMIDSVYADKRSKTYVAISADTMRTWKHYPTPDSAYDPSDISITGHNIVLYVCNRADTVNDTICKIYRSNYAMVEWAEIFRTASEYDGYNYCLSYLDTSFVYIGSGKNTIALSNDAGSWRVIDTCTKYFPKGIKFVTARGEDGNGVVYSIYSSFSGSTSGHCDLFRVHAGSSYTTEVDVGDLPEADLYDVRIYPNPVPDGDYVMIQFRETPPPGISVKAFDILGNELFVDINNELLETTGVVRVQFDANVRIRTIALVISDGLMRVNKIINLQ